MRLKKNEFLIKTGNDEPESGIAFRIEIGKDEPEQGVKFRVTTKPSEEDR